MTEHAATLPAWTSRDTASPVWQPFTQMKLAPAPLKVRRGRGYTLELEDGREIIDCISSWWVTIHGHAEPRIAEAISRQACMLEQVIFAGFTHEPAEILARQVLALLPANLTRVFYTDNGSTAVEAAVKMALQYWHNLGQPQRKRFIGLSGGYHGDTVGAMSVGQSAGFWDVYQPLLFPIETIPFPQTWEGDSSAQEKEEKSLADLGRLLDEHGAEVAAIIVEPLVQGASGMRMCRPQFLQALARVAADHDVLVIYDEVMTGFGRTGELFASVKAGTQPDIIALSKGLTGGFLPLAITACAEKIYQAFYSDDVHKMFFHSHSFTANPIACSAAIASLELLVQSTSYRTMEAHHRKLSEHYLGGSTKVERVRFCGTIYALDVKSADCGGYFDRVGQRLRSAFLEAGLLVRPLGNTVYLLPPYCMGEDVLSLVHEKVAGIIDRVIS